MINIKIRTPQTTTGKVSLIVFIIIIATLGSVAVMKILWVWGQGLVSSPNSPLPPFIYLDKQEDDNYWNLTVREIGWYKTEPYYSMQKDYLRLSNTMYVVFPNNMSNMLGSLEYAPLSNITDKPSGYNITFLDNDHDSMVSVNDTIRISRSGGVKGTIKAGDYLELICEMTTITDEVWL